MVSTIELFLVYRYRHFRVKHLSDAYEKTIQKVCQSRANRVIMYPSLLVTFVINLELWRFNIWINQHHPAVKSRQVVKEVDKTRTTRREQISIRVPS